MELAKDTAKATMRRSGVGAWLDNLGRERRIREYAEQLAHQAREWPANKAMRVLVHPVIEPSGGDYVVIEGDEVRAQVRLLCIARGPFRVSLVSYSLRWAVSLGRHEIAWGHTEMPVGHEWQEKGGERELRLSFIGRKRGSEDVTNQYALVGVSGTVLVAGAWDTEQSPAPAVGAAYLPITRL